MLICPSDTEHSPRIRKPKKHRSRREHSLESVNSKRDQRERDDKIKIVESKLQHPERKETEEEYDARLEREEAERLEQERMRALIRIREARQDSMQGIVRLKGELNWYLTGWFFDIVSLGRGRMKYVDPEHNRS